jgi:hypothetical protein
MRLRSTSLYISDRIRLFLVFFGIPLLFVPKISVMSLRGGVNSFRIDDIILAILFAVIGMSYVRFRRDFLEKPEYILALFIFFGIVSNFFGDGSIFYPIRELEYFVMYYVGIHFGKKSSIFPIIYITIFANFVVCCLQFPHIIGSFQDGSYEPSGPVIGMNAGNWETGNILNIVLAVFLFGFNTSNIKSSFFIVMTMACMILLGSRTPAANTILLSAMFIIYKTSRSGNLFKVIIGGALVVIVTAMTAGLFWGVVSKTALIERSAKLFTTDFSSVFSDFWRLVPPMDHFDIVNSGASNFLDVVNESYAQSDRAYDFSFLVRLLKIVGSLKYYFDQDPFIWLIGTGPGRYSDAMDSGHVRLLVENGIIGYFLFFLWINSVLKYCPARKPIIILFFFSMFALDTYLNYKTISFILFIGGYYVAIRGKPQNNRESHDLSPEFGRAASASPRSVLESA